jgi:hypothetical protein
MYCAALPDWLHESAAYPRAFGEDNAVMFEELAAIAKKAPSLRTPMDLLLISK